MKVDGPRAIEAARTARPRGAQGAAGSFAPEAYEETRAPARAPGGAAIAAVTTLIALQEAPDALVGRAKAARRGRDMLDLLDELRAGLLAEGVSRATLLRLAGLADAEREDFADPQLTVVLDEIDLRVRVELAKLDFELADSAGTGGGRNA